LKGHAVLEEPRDVSKCQWILDRLSHKMAEDQLTTPPPQTPPQTPTPTRQKQLHQISTTRTNSKSISRATDTALLKNLSTPEKYSKFAQVCNTNLELFGTPGSALRKKVQNRRRFLLRLEETDPKAFAELLTESGILLEEDELQQQQEEEVEADLQQQQQQQPHDQQQQQQQQQQAEAEVEEDQNQHQQCQPRVMSSRSGIMPGRFRKFKLLVD
jgi:hypothetical protein